ncbi:LEAF RUST 10 DISEASE-RESISTANCEUS RECEPTOR-LIKE PROTEIN KINASE-like 2.4 [Gossypium hirsutum]|uniref:non-specific serine/threonine protein kinase n=1 Tax=Gossypium hirsutum TaxID=3635 RepID=A0A1U8KIF5_GOSHI|nr:LEAF RUST 10 DISEASE-RESISTANCE LOCUS RECEPTOR-LIKE PROTEIN KINASE-like 2.4 [Gossypium hirsutum]
MISPHGGTGGDCNSTGCVADLNGDCPSELKVVNGSETVACKSACSALGEPQYCCSGEYYSLATCQPTSYSQFFKTACPTAYSYAFDDDATSMFHCVEADYDITFCPTPSTSPDQLYEKCRDAVFKCGDISIGYPFSGGDRDPECGHPGLELHCEVFTNTTKIEIVGVKYEVLDIRHENQILRIARKDFIKNGSCHPQIPIQDSILNSEPFVLGSGNTNLTMSYDCQSSSSLGIFPCDSSNYNNVSITTNNIRPDGCSANVRVPILQSSWERLRNDSLDLEEALETGFEVQWKEDAEACRKCNVRGSVVGVVSISTICFTVLRFKGKLLSNYPRQGKKNDDARIEEFITKFGPFAPKRYSYEEIKKMTNKFNDKLGQGGFGSVYKGKLPDGHLVAVKFLSEMKGNREDFMNEVASISRTSHVNIVTLLGFCFERSKRALIYEFMPKGSLDKFIYGQGSDNQSRQLEWVTLYDIVLGIARGLEYLHQGCNTRILHFDIKPHNILLDENFCPKISDFGLSKLCERKKSIVSMTGARGTAGYIAPEVFFRNLGGVSHKSDVYSYGMMVLEMVGGRKSVNVEASQTSEIYFPSWIYKHLDQSTNLNINEEITEEEAEITRKLIAVSLWCIQTNPLDRPSMTRVLEMLQGSIQSLELPPRPT